jgi:hypothetical protein
LSEKYEISAIPMLLFFENGTLLDQTVGMMTKNDIVAKFHKKNA